MFNTFKKKLTFIFQKYPLIGSVVVFGLVFAVYFSIYFSAPGLPYHDDHFFHFKYAYLLRTLGLEVSNHFDWVYLSNYTNGDLAYKPSLFQIALIPFTYFKDMEIGLKIADIFWASAALGLIYYALRKLKISHVFLWVSFLAATDFSMNRLLAGRSFVLALGMILLLMYFAIQKKYFKFFITSLIYVFWQQSTFFMPLVVAAIVEISRYISFREIKIKGIIGGLLAMFFTLLYFSFKTFVMFLSLFKKIITETVPGEGLEIYKRDIFQIFNSSEMFLFFLLISFAFVFYVYISNRSISEEKRPKSIITVYVAFLFLLMSLAGTIMANGRFFDYYGIGVIFLIGSCVLYLEQKGFNFDKKLKNFVLVGAFIFLLISGTNTFINIKKIIYNSDYSTVKKTAEWIGSKSENRDKVYLYNWGYFPLAFFYNDKNIYSMGMDPMLLFYYNEGLYWKWYNIHNYGLYCDKGMDCKDMAIDYSNLMKNTDEDKKKSIIKENGRMIIESIKNDFNAKFAIIDNSNVNDFFKLNEDLILDSFEAKSEINENIVWGYELK